LDCGEVYEDIVFTIITTNETIPFWGTEPFDGSNITI